MGWCIMYIRIRLLLHIRPFISSFFFLSNFQTLTFFVTLFSGTLTPRRLKLGTSMDSGQMYRVYRNQADAAFLSLYFSFVFLSNFQTENFSSHFSPELWGLEGWNLLHTWKMGGCIVYTGIMLLLLFIPSFFYFSFSSIIKHLKFSSHFSQGLWDLEHWNLIHVHTWTVGRCIVYTGIRLQLHICPFISSFFFLSNFLRLIFCHIFLRNCEA